MELPENSSLTLGLTEEGLPQYSREPSHAVACFLGFDPAHQRLVEIRRFGPETILGIFGTRTLRERLALAERLYHPGLAVVVESGTDPGGCLYVATEFIDGENFLEYLKRVPPLPRQLGIHLALQLAEVAGYLTDYPRLLATIRLDDFVVCLERGHHLRLRLLDPGLERDDLPVSDSELGSYWIEIVGLILEHFLEGRELPTASEFEAISPGRFELSGNLGELILRLRHESGSAAIRELKGLKSALLNAAGFCPDYGEHLDPVFSSITDVAHRPIGPLSLLIGDSAELESLTKTRWRLRDDGFPGDGFSPFVLRARSHRSPSATLDDKGERFDLLLLPPERLVNNGQTTRLNLQMGHRYLKEHPSLVRTRSIICDTDFTLVASPGTNGFTLLELVSRRGHLTPEEGALVLEQVNRLLTHLEGADMGLHRLDPTRVVIHFDETLPRERIESLVTSTPLDQWPAVITRLRPLPTTESHLSPEAGSWRHLLRRLDGKSLPALILWALESDRFDQLLGQGRAIEAPLSERPEISDLFTKAAVFLDPERVHHRQKLLELLQSAAASITVARNQARLAEATRDEHAVPLGNNPDSIHAEIISPAESRKRRGWRFGRPVSAASA